MKALSLLPLFLFLLLFFIVVGCGSDDDDDDNESPPFGLDDDDTGDDDNVDDDDSAGDVKVTWEYFLVDSVMPPPNPVTGSSTPAEFNKVPVMRFRKDSGNSPPTPVKAILILLPGNVAGLTDFYFMAHDLILEAKGDMEVWALDRRTNHFEDQTGLDAAEAAKDPRIILDYYFNGQSINGKTYNEWVDPYGIETEFMSEWGVDLFMKDIRSVIHLIPEEYRKTNVFIGGHSRGVGYAQMFAAYQFDDGQIGADDLAGILLCDGARRYTEITEFEYLKGIDDLRTGLSPRHKVMTANDTLIPKTVQFLGMASTEGFGDPDDPEMGPDGVLEDLGLLQFLVPLLTWFHDSDITNEALFGLALDDESGLPGVFYGTFGKLTGGPLGTNFLGTCPSADGYTYSWANYDEVEPEELSDVQRFIQITFIGPSDFGDLFMSERYQLDDWSCGPLETEGTWMHKYLKFYTSRVDIPVYALKGAMLDDTPFYNDYMELLPSVAGYSKPRSEVGFHTFNVLDWGHIDTILVAGDRNIFYKDFLVWIDKWARGAVQVDLIQ